jgi:hypothetical protein
MQCVFLGGIRLSCPPLNCHYHEIGFALKQVVPVSYYDDPYMKNSQLFTLCKIEINLKKNSNKKIFLRDSTEERRSLQLKGLRPLLINEDGLLPKIVDPSWQSSYGTETCKTIF